MQKRAKVLTPFLDGPRRWGFDATRTAPAIGERAKDFQRETGIAIQELESRAKDQIFAGGQGSLLSVEAFELLEKDCDGVTDARVHTPAPMRFSLTLGRAPPGAMADRLVLCGR
jgi:hypothetical protein